MLSAGLSEERSLQNGAAPQWSQAKWGSKEDNHIKDPLEENYQSKDERTSPYSRQGRGRPKENACRAWHASLGNCSLTVSWKSPEGRRWLGELQWQPEERGLPGSSLHFQRAKGPSEGDLIQSVKVHPSEVYLQGHNDSHGTGAERTTGGEGDS